MWRAFFGPGIVRGAWMAGAGFVLGTLLVLVLRRWWGWEPYWNTDVILVVGGMVAAPIGFLGGIGAFDYWLYYISGRPTRPEDHSGHGAHSWKDYFRVNTDHKVIGIQYLVTTFVFFTIGGLMAMFFRAELAQPGLQFVDSQTFNGLVSAHATLMIFLFIIPAFAGLANFAVPLMLGAPDMAFPRLNALSFWLLPIAGIMFLASFLAPGGAFGAGWTGYAPLAEGQPFFCMGQQGGNVNIWHWKADWQADITARKDMETLYPNMYVDQYPFTSVTEPNLAAPGDYTDPNYLPALASGNLFASATRASPVEDLIAGGFGSLTAQPADGQNVQGFGRWANGKWHVVFSRDLASKEADDVTFAPGKVYSMAFAAWDGANGERNGQKSTSQWVSLQVEGAAPVQPPRAQPTATPNSIEGIFWAVIPMALMTLLILGLAGAVFLISKLPDKK